ncbi:MAG: polyprenyl synthetase family protein [Marinilabiliales bacterium]|nr:polyprenyl synthetase family protein [Marinilabiliales bacterium]
MICWTIPADGLTGKREGNDIKEKKITLPLIHALREAGPVEEAS